MFRLIPVPEECWSHEEFREVMQLDAEVRIKIHGVSVHSIQLCCTSVEHITAALSSHSGNFGHALTRCGSLFPVQPLHLLGRCMC